MESMGDDASWAAAYFWGILEQAKAPYFTL
jgi:hypothetical protein